MTTPQSYLELHWDPVELLDFRRFKGADILYDTYLLFVKQILNSCSLEQDIAQD